ncbi:uncharacterized protein A1O9_06622 [Exophiala aquamarina CBS 119918]|uniref:Transcription factor domain-containing protein n=1 Tax=Exophiala aquamarina CBS 119918 TaxID=1182545 RepID=A0A072PFR7_9EURO|nr:uncharacterized protein A1O9_06622 [Exophiala aquamarina CBS 119918]KEF58696.1 hypothetical protein A1O9_06622 [Exophiala aquamarina CBS 119918]
MQNITSSGKLGRQKPVLNVFFPKRNAPTIARAVDVEIEGKPAAQSSSAQSEPGARAPSSVVGSQGLGTLHGAENEPIAFASSQNQEQFVDRVECRAFSSVDMPLAGSQRSAGSHMANGPAFSSIWDSNIFLNDSALNVDDDILMEIDFDWNSLIPADYDLNHESQARSIPPHLRVSNAMTSASRSRVPLVQEFYKRCLWLWDPDPHDSATMDESSHLSEAEEPLLLSSTATEKVSVDKVAGSSIMADFACGSDARDALLLLVQRNSDITVAVCSFPSPKVLSLLLRAFAVQETVSPVPFLHLSSFRVNKCRTELLSALIVAGSANFANRQIWKLGLAIQERTRLDIYQTVDHNNSIARDLEFLQAQILWVEAGLWSGVRRTMEVAQSAANNVPFVGNLSNPTNIQLNVAVDTKNWGLLFGLLRAHVGPNG